MSLTILPTLLDGSGIVPKNVRIGDIVQFQATGVETTSHFWELLSKPNGSGAYITQPDKSLVKLVSIDKNGTYQARVWTDRTTYKEKSSIISISVPNVNNPLPNPPEPLYDTGGRVLNFSFELEGVLPGYAFNWETVDDADILNDYGGISRGRIIPTNFDVTSGLFVMCLGDDIGLPHVVRIGQEFGVKQQVDLRGISTMNLQVKFIKRS